MSLLKEVKRYLTNWPPDTPSGPVILGDPPRAIPVSESRETYPAVNLWEDDDFVYAQAMLPGEKLPDLEITVAVNEDKSYLAIKGVRKNLKPEKAVWHNRERHFGGFERTIDLDVPVEANQADAVLDDGVLVVKMAKCQQAKPKEIPVKPE